LREIASFTSLDEREDAGQMEKPDALEADILAEQIQ